MLWASALTGRPRLRAAAMAALVAGAFALAADPARAPWALPRRPAELALLTPWASGILTAIYLLASFATLADRRRALSLPATCALLALPFLFNLLLALDSRDFMAWIGERFAVSAALAPWAGRALTLWLFNAAAVIAAGWVVDHRGTRSAVVHALLLAAALAAASTSAVADLGSSAAIAASPAALRLLGVITSGALSEAGLWAEVFLVTGVILDAMRLRRPTARSCARHWTAGLRRGAIFGGLYLLLAHAVAAGAGSAPLETALRALPLTVGALVGAFVFPLARTLFESFDGSDPFLWRLARAYRNPMNAVRGLCAGALLAVALLAGLPRWDEALRFLAGFAIGALAYGGADLLRDLAAILVRRRQRLQRARIYLVGVLLGGVVGGGLAWYFDPAQLAVVAEKVRRYAEVSVASAGGAAQAYVVYPLFSKWGAIDLGAVLGGARLLWAESMAGVANWAIAAPLFAVNLVLLTALFERSLAPLRELFSRAGLVGVFAQTIRVLRWGPWMAPIIFTFLRLSPQPTWYNQDGLVRTLVAIAQSLSLPPGSFLAWSLQCFLGLLAYDWLRVLIWFDHMGLRVATLVNLSFVGADALDEKTARFLGSSARTRAIPEGVRRFFTWAPLLLPFYLPRGRDWDYVWTGAERLASEPAAPLLPAVRMLLSAYVLAAIGGLAVVAAILALRHFRRLRSPPRRLPSFTYRLGNGAYTLQLNPDGSGYARVESALHAGLQIDLTRRPDDRLQLRGKWFWLRETAAGAPPEEAWSLTALPSGHPEARYGAGQPRPTLARFVAERGDLRVEAEVEVAAGPALELWRLRLANLADRPRALEITSYRELALAPTDSYRRSPDFAAMHVATCFFRPLGALLARNRRLLDRRGRSSPEAAFHAVDADGERVRLLGYEDSRAAFVGAGSLRRAAVFAGRAMRDPGDEGRLYTFDPIASLRVQAQLPASGAVTLRFVDGYAKDTDSALHLIARAFGRAFPAPACLEAGARRARTLRGFESGAPREPAFSADGTEVRAPAGAARPWTHLLANAAELGAIVAADGALFAFNGNAQQNALTPALESPPGQARGQLLALVDPGTGEAFNAAQEATFGLGYARFRSRYEGLELEESIVVPPDAPLLLRELRVRNTASSVRRLRAVAFAEIVLAETAVDSLGRIEVREDEAALLFRNPDNDFRKGWAFVATNLADAARETVRARFLGDAVDAAGADFVWQGKGDPAIADDGRRCAAFAGALELHPGEAHRVTMVIGQATDADEALGLARRFRQASIEAALQATRAWWLAELGVLQVETDRPELDRLVNLWLPYQVLTARLWGRCGPQQRGGAFGFRDQLQDVMPLAWTHPALARSQILLHAAQQFREGDVLMWWHRSWEGRTGIGARSAASDPHLWLPYVVAHYVRASGDRSLLRVRLPFLEAPRPGPRGRSALVAPRPSRDEASVYEHCRRAIDRASRHASPRGLPLIGSGDWNDGLNALGVRGRGESVWLGFFLHAVLRDFAPLAREQGDLSSARRWELAASRLRAALAPAWRGEGYVRATSDKGRELDFASILMGAWPALSGAVADDRARAALQSALRALEKDDRVLLLAPPFDETSRPYPGSIAEYPPGVRENGAQYSHGASWAVDAWLCLARNAAARGERGEAERCQRRAWEIWWKISPLSKTDPAYGLPPHQQPADVYDGRGYAGRGGWAWYTGSAARMLQAAYGLLGLEMSDGELRLASLPLGPGVPRLRRLRFKGREIALPSTAR